MASQAEKKRLAQAAQDAADAVSRLATELPADEVQKIYNDVVFSLAAKTKLGQRMRPAAQAAGLPPAASGSPAQE